MKTKHFTFLYIPEHNAQPRTFRIPRGAVFGVATAAMLFALVAAGAVWKYSGKIKDTYKLATLERSNSEMRTQLSSFEDQISLLRRQVAQNFDFQKKARLLANLDDLSEDVTEVGIGGPDFVYVETLADLDEETRDWIVGAHADIGKMLRQTRLQQEGYGEILDSLEETDKRLRSTPSIRPVGVGSITSRFGRRMDPITGRRTMHRGLDFAARLGTPVHAPADGVVTFSGKWQTYGEVIEISHGYGFVTRFAHLQKRLVKKGQRVRRDDIIGRVGSSGKSTFSHLHYEVEREGNRVDPLKFVLN